MKKLARFLLPVLLSWTAAAAWSKTSEGRPFALFLAGKPSHRPGAHEYNAGVLLLAQCLAQGAPQLVVKTYLNNAWPDPADLAAADTILIYCDGGIHHPLLQADRLTELGAQMRRGAGLVALHFAVEFPKDKGGPEALDWLGGNFETDWSVNPVWTADYRELPRHPITRGVKPFVIEDEWYFHLRFNDRAGTVTPILSAIPPASSMSRPDGTHSGNPTVRAEVAAHLAQTTAWAYVRPDGGRGFGFTGGHFHSHWANADQRKLVLNAILWTAHLEVPANGVESTVTAADLSAHLDPKPPRKPGKAAE